jgi:hypothetical protein
MQCVSPVYLPGKYLGIWLVLAEAEIPGALPTLGVYKLSRLVE